MSGFNNDDLLLNYLQNITSTHRTLNIMSNVLTQQERNVNNLITLTRERERRITNNNRNRNILSQSFIRQSSIPIGEHFNLPFNFPLNNRNNRNNRNIGSIGNNRNNRNIRNIDLIDNSIIYNTFSNINNPLNNSCPINRELFNPDDNVIQIIPCGHVFNESALLRWFENNTTCPMCRFNLLNQSRTNNNVNTQNNENQTQTQTQENSVNITPTVNTSNNALSDNILNIISENILNEINNLSDLSGNITSDISGNANEISFIVPVLDYR